MKLKSILIPLTIVFATTCSLNAQTRPALIDSLMQASHQAGIFNGNVLVAGNGEIIYQSSIGYADGSKENHLSPELRFDIGSISKEFNAVGIMILKEQGKLALADKVSKFIPDLPAWSDEITVRDLLQYTSGLPKVDYEDVVNDADAWRNLRALKHLEFEPGTDYLYSNNNVFLQKRIIEKVSGQSYRAFLEQNIFKPCGMKNAVVDPGPGAPALAKAFDNKFVEDDFPMVMSGWVRLTIHDLFQWAAQLHSYQIIDKSSLYELFDSFESKQSSLGHSEFENSELLWHGHQGSSYNFEALLYVNRPKDITVILMTNNKNFNVGSLTMAIEAILSGEPFEIPKKSVYMDLRTEIYYNGFAKGILFYDDIRMNKRNAYDFSKEENDLNKVGAYLVGKDRIDDGMQVFSFIIKEFPESAKAYYNLGEAYFKLGNKNLALQNYEKSFELDDRNKHAKEMIERIRSGINE